MRFVPARPVSLDTGRHSACSPHLPRCSRPAGARRSRASPLDERRRRPTRARANVTITAQDGCTADKTSFPAGALTFKIANKDATAVSEVELLSGERIVGEKENLPPGFTGSFAVQRRRRHVHAVLPRRAAGAARTLTVTGTGRGHHRHATSQALLDAGHEGLRDVRRRPRSATWSPTTRGACRPRCRAPTSRPRRPRT